MLFTRPSATTTSIPSPDAASTSTPAWLPSKSPWTKTGSATVHRFFYASGDSSNRSGASRTDGTAHGFDTIVDDTHFAGSDFSFWDHEGLRLTGTGIALMNPVEPSAQPAFEQRRRPGQLRKSRPLFVQPGRGFQRHAEAARIRKRQLSTFRSDRTARTCCCSSVRFATASAPTWAWAWNTVLRSAKTLCSRAAYRRWFQARGFEEIYNGKTLFSVFAKIKFQF